MPEQFSTALIGDNLREMESAPWQAVAALVDPVRRSLYEHVRTQGRPVTREEAADAVAISRNLTAFHLDKLVDAGLLRARYEAPPDQPRGRGRTPKVYEVADEGVSLNVPPRQYELVGEILADAVAASPADAHAEAVRRATEVGRELGAVAGGVAGSTVAGGAEPGVEADQAAAYAVLLDLGFEPVTDGTSIVLRNCPFHRLAARQTELICGLNEAFIRGLLDGLGAGRLTAELRPRPGHCCVQVSSCGEVSPCGQVSP
jgi:predicted ArsR family transcriptional regulator